jgi:tRNA dimethylallyltransferase
MTLYALVGPTASGKSRAALALAERAHMEILSCDSMQVYRGMDIGSAKPTAAERARVRHHLIDEVEVDQPFSAARYVELAERAIDEVSGRGRRVLLVGGTGLYLRALRFGLFAAPARDEALRQRLQEEEGAQPGALHRRLAEVDPESAHRLEPRDLQRIIRALEVFELTGKPFSQHLRREAPRDRRPIRIAVLDPGKEPLRASVEERSRAMLAAGFVDEVRALVARFTAAPRPLHSVGYAEVLEHLAGRLSLAALPEAISRSTMQYARRQRTWFKKEPDARHFADASEAVAALVGE